MIALVYVPATIDRRGLVGWADRVHLRPDASFDAATKAPAPDEPAGDPIPGTIITVDPEIPTNP